MAINKGSFARIIQPVIEGQVTSVKYDEDTGVKRILLSWTDADGEAQERWFGEGDLEIVEPAKS